MSGSRTGPMDVAVHHRFAPDFSGIQDLLPHITQELTDEPAALSCGDRVPSSLVRGACLTGTPSEILDQMSEWRDNGVRYAVWRSNLSSLHPRLRGNLFSSLPLVQALCSMRRL